MSRWEKKTEEEKYAMWSRYVEEFGGADNYSSFCDTMEAAYRLVDKRDDELNA